MNKWTLVLLGGIVVVLVTWTIVQHMRRPIQNVRLSHWFLNEDTLKRYPAEQISIDPPIWVVHNVLDESVCNHLVQLGQQRMHRSTVVDKSQIHQDRTSWSAFLDYEQDPIVQYTESLMQSFIHLPRTHLEGLQVVRYEPGQQYKPHYDWFVPGSELFDQHMVQGGQRLVTIFAYIEASQLTGGKTSFPNLNVSVTPRLGSIVIWPNVMYKQSKTKMAKFVEDPRTLHGGEPVIHGRKHGLNVWFRHFPVRI